MVRRTKARLVGNESSHAQHIRLPSVVAGHPFGLNFNFCVMIPEVQTHLASNSRTYLAFAVQGEYTLSSLGNGSHDRVGASPLFCCRRLGRALDRLSPRSLWSEFGKNPRGRGTRGAFGRTGSS